MQFMQKSLNKVFLIVEARWPTRQDTSSVLWPACWSSRLYTIGRRLNKCYSMTVAQVELFSVVWTTSSADQYYDIIRLRVLLSKSCLQSWGNEKYSTNLRRLFTYWQGLEPAPYLYQMAKAWAWFYLYLYTSDATDYSLRAISWCRLSRLST
jgi:hypothetical protein